MDFFITLALILGVVIVPGLINYYVCRFYTLPGTSTAPTLDLVVASLTLVFVGVVFDIAALSAVSLVWDGLKEEISEFVQLGLLDYARDRPIALPGVLAAYSLSAIALFGLLGVLRVPSRWIR